MKALHALVLVAAAALFATVASAHDLERGPGGWATFRGADALTLPGVRAMTLRYPRRLFARPLVENGYAGGSQGVLISNLNRVVRRRKAFLNGAFPARGVAVEVAEWSSAPDRSRPGANDARLPLRASLLRPFPYWNLHLQWLPFQVYGLGFTVIARVGAQASHRDRAAVASIIASIRFPSLRAQTFAPEGLYVLGRPARFRDAVTRLDSELPRQYRTAQPPLPLFLVSTRSGFHTLPARASLGRARRSCALVFDRRAMQLLCRRTGTRWNLAGRVVAARRAPADWSLDRVCAPVSSDGYILVRLYQTAPPA